MPKFTVHLMTPYCSWEDVEAKNRKEAIDKCHIPPEFDCNDPFVFTAVEEGKTRKEARKHEIHKRKN